MSDAIGILSAVSEPKRRSRLADFFTRLVREKPLGTIGAIIVLILILVAIFADVLAPYGYYENTPGGQADWHHRPSICWGPTI